MAGIGWRADMAKIGVLTFGFNGFLGRLTEKRVRPVSSQAPQWPQWNGGPYVSLIFNCARHHGTMTAASACVLQRLIW